MTAPNAPKTVLVTGAAKRLGREIALNLAQAGWQVAVHFRHSESDAHQTVADCSKLGGPSACFQADLSDEAQVRALLPQVVERLGGLIAVVNCASTFEQDRPEDFSFKTLDQHLHSNAGAAILLAQALHAHLQQQGQNGQAVRGVVVNLLDQKLWNLNPDFFSYTLSKAALEAANTMMAMAFAPQLRVVGVAPGLTIHSHLQSAAQFEAAHRLSPLGQSSTPQDVATTVKFALENGSITGTTLLVDGGQHLIRFERDFSMMNGKPE